MAYKLKFSPLQSRFVETCCLFAQLSYPEMVQVWIYSGGSSSKVPSSLIKKLESLNILEVNRLKQENRYVFNASMTNEIFTRLGTLRDIPAESLMKRSEKSQQFDERFEHHDRLLYALALSTLGHFKSYDLSFPKERNINASRLIPDAIYQLKHSKDDCLYLEFDNLTEGSIDFSSKLPRYIQWFEQEPHSLKLVFVFKGEPVVRISHMLSALHLTRTIQGIPTYDWLSHHLSFSVYFLTESLWKNLGEEIASPLQTENLEAFNVLQLIQRHAIEPEKIRAHYRLTTQKLLSSKGIISAKDDSLDLFSASDYDLPEHLDEPGKKMFT